LRNSQKECSKDFFTDAVSELYRQTLYKKLKRRRSEGKDEGGKKRDKRKLKTKGGKLRKPGEEG
jgi:hypothetical protein